MTLCAGIALLGLCLPMPGFPLDDLKAADWRNEGNSSDWSSSRIFQSGTYVISTLVEGDARRVTSIWLSELRDVDRTSASSPLRQFLSTACTADAGVSNCVAAGMKFERMPCAGGWMLFLPEAVSSRKELAQRCAKYAPLFESARKQR